MKSPVDKLMELVFSMVARLKEDHYSSLTFENLLRLAAGLQKECPLAVAGYKCYVVTDKDDGGYRVGIFPVDSRRQTFGGEDVVMKVVRADGLDDMIRSLLPNEREGSFFVPAE